MTALTRLTDPATSRLAATAHVKSGAVKGTMMVTWMEAGR
jgi:hypothetical protein